MKYFKLKREDSKPLKTGLGGDTKAPPEITDALRAEARHQPGGYVYVIDHNYAPDGKDGAIPREGIIGAYPVDDNGEIVPVFAFNPHYKQPS